MTASHVTSANSDLFYDGLAPFYDFAEFVELDAYAPVPDDWIVMIADVRGSTRAIEEGRYKDVNMVGASCRLGGPPFLMPRRLLRTAPS